jgi:hypothetical protein
MNYRLKKISTITFRVTEAEHALIRNAAAAAADDFPNSWCRHVVLRYAGPDQMSTSEDLTTNRPTAQSSIRVSPNPLSSPKNGSATITVTLSPCGTTNVQVKTF